MSRRVLPMPAVFVLLVCGGLAACGGTGTGSVPPPPAGGLRGHPGRDRRGARAGVVAEPRRRAHDRRRVRGVAPGNRNRDRHSDRRLREPIRPGVGRLERPGSAQPPDGDRAVAVAPGRGECLGRGARGLGPARRHRRQHPDEALHSVGRLGAARSRRGGSRHPGRGRLEPIGRGGGHGRGVRRLAAARVPGDLPAEACYEPARPRPPQRHAGDETRSGFAHP